MRLISWIRHHGSEHYAFIHLRNYCLCWPKEIDTSEEKPAFLQALLAMRRWDEQAKDPAIPLLSNQKYVTMAIAILNKKDKGEK